MTVAYGSSIRRRKYCVSCSTVRSSQIQFDGENSSSGGSSSQGHVPQVP